MDLPVTPQKVCPDILAETAIDANLTFRLPNIASTQQIGSGRIVSVMGCQRQLSLRCVAVSNQSGSLRFREPLRIASNSL
jgi:hypothetical protein